MDDTLTGQSPSGQPMRLRYSAVSDVGRHRKENQDSGYASGNLLVIADGVGGAAYGDVASATAVHLLRRLDQPPGEEMLSALAGAVHRVHDKLAEMVEHDSELDGTSTTVTAALFDGHRLGVAHVGDSRAYLLRQGATEQVTHDHTFVQTLIDEGRITEEEARVHPHRNIILRAVDGVRETEADLFYLDLLPGDRVMLCSDGCSGVLDTAAIGALLSDGSVDSAAKALVQASLDNGTTDNVTVVVAEAVASPAPVQAPVQASVPAAAGDETQSDTQGDTQDDTQDERGALIVGAAAAQPRRGGMLSRALFRRQTDTGELEPVPDVPIDPEELRYLPRAPHRHAGLRRLLMILVPLLLVAGALAGGYLWSQNQYYVSDDGDFVAIYQGVQMDIPGIELSSVYETDTLQVADLPEFNQEQVREGIVADSYSDAQRIVGNLEEQVVECPTDTSQSAGDQNKNQDKNNPDKNTDDKNTNDKNDGNNTNNQQTDKNAAGNDGGTKNDAGNDTTDDTTDGTTDSGSTSDACGDEQ